MSEDTPIPMTGPAKLAWGVILFSAAGWIGLELTLRPVPPAWLPLLHALEGAFVGGMCDAFAIWKVYEKIEENYETVTQHTAEIVVRDMVQPEQAIQELIHQLQQPEFAGQLLGQLDALLPQREVVKAFVQQTWEQSLRYRVAEQLTELDPRPWMREIRDAPEPSQEGSLHRDTEVRATVHHCLRYALEDASRSHELFEAFLQAYGDKPLIELRLIGPITVEWVFRRALSPERLQDWLLQQLDSFLLDGEPDLQPLVRLRDVGLDYGIAYTEGWVELSQAQRMEAAQSLLDHLAPPILDAIVEAVWDQRKRIQELLGGPKAEREQKLLRHLSQEVGGLVQRQLSSLDQQALEKLSEQLGQMGPRGFRRMLERNTREQLDHIQVNGALLGLVLGGLLGTISWLLHS